MFSEDEMRLIDKIKSSSTDMREQTMYRDNHAKKVNDQETALIELKKTTKMYQDKIDDHSKNLLRYRRELIHYLTLPALEPKSKSEERESDTDTLDALENRSTQETVCRRQK